MKKAPEFELYDLEKDPYEWDNLAGKKKFRDEFDKLSGALSGWQSETKDPLADKKLAEKLFLEIVNANGKKIEIKYHDYMDPGPLTEE